MMLALIKKDLRVFLVPTVGGVVLITCAYLVGAAASLYGPNSPWMNYIDSIGPAASIGMVTVVLLASAYGGSSFAVERREHSSDWLNMLPVTRRQIVASKVVTAFICMAALWIYDALPIVVIYSNSPMLTYAGKFASLSRLFLFISPMVFSMLASCWILFAFAWLFSTFLESAAISACIAIPIALAGPLIIGELRLVLPVEQNTLVEIMFIVWALGATASFLLGTYYYLNRVEP